MDRRQFLIALGSAAAARSVAQGNSSLAAGANALRNGDNQLELVHGPDGIGLALFTFLDGRMMRVAQAQYPVRVFYGIRAIDGLTNVAFDHAKKTTDRIEAGAEFTDRQSNRWQVAFRATRAAHGGFDCSFDYRLIEGTAENVFFEHSLVPEMRARGEETYVLMPGLLYDGNRLTVPAPTLAIPQLGSTQAFKVDTPVYTLAMPVAAFLEKRTGKTLMVVTEPETELGISGFSCVAREDDHRISVIAPVYREKLYKHKQYVAAAPAGATVQPGATFSVPVSYFAMYCADVPGLFAALQPVRAKVRPGFERAKRLPLSAAAAMVEENFNTRMWAGSADEQFYINAMFPDYDIAKKTAGGLIPGWQLQVGWCAGAITGYALLKMGTGQSCQRARAMFDRIATGISPSGLFWSIYANGKWDPQRNNGSGGWQHMRMSSDATFYFLKALALERTRGIEHPNWEKAAIGNLNGFTQLWTKHRDFGHRVDFETLTIMEPGTAAGALCIGGLALGAKLPRGHEYLAAAREASKAYYERYVRTGWIVGGPLDIPNAPDSESATALLESYVTMYEVTRDRVYLDYARDTARLLSTWVVAYNAKFPEGSFCQKHGVQTVGGVLANAQNHHIGPSFCTNSGSALLRLYRHTGDEPSLRLLEDAVSGLPQFVSTGKEPFSKSSNEGGSEMMGAGMVSEMFSMSDELAPRGAMGWVCASWPETCVLLSYGEVPSVFVDVERDRCAVFDQIEARFDVQTGSLHLGNPSGYPAKVRVETSRGRNVEIALSAGETRVVSLAGAETAN